MAGRQLAFLRVYVHHVIAFRGVFMGCKVCVAVRVGVGMGVTLRIGIGLSMPICRILFLHQRACHVEMRARCYPQARRNKRLEQDSDHYQQHESTQGERVRQLGGSRRAGLIRVLTWLEHAFESCHSEEQKEFMEIIRHMVPSGNIGGWTSHIAAMRRQDIS